MRIARALKALRAGSVISHHVGPLIYGGLAARLAGIGRVAHVEHDAWHLDNKWRRMIVTGALRLIRPKRIAVSQKVAGSAKLHTGLDFETISNGIDCSRFLPADKAETRKSLGLPAGRKIVGAAGRLETVKGFDLLVRAAKYLDPDTLVVIWGQGSCRLRIRICCEN